MTKSIKCPTCKKNTKWSTENQWRPFCSERCKLIDLGSWADESFKISGKTLNQAEEINPYLTDPDSES